MSQEIEIEFKNLLTKEEFLQIQHFFDFKPENFHVQINHYFDTADFYLKDKGCALRIREKNGRFELTLKQPAPTGLLETSQTLSASEAKEVMETNLLPKGPVKGAVDQLSEDVEGFLYFGSLTTERAEKNYQGGLVVLDHSSYLNTEDYEIEFEVAEEKKGQEVFESLLQQLKIPIRKTDNKIMRFYKRKYDIGT
ncbi:CYTH domain-containing protein [Mesobacillus foraminis]|uniref:CYTH domain-containing protein n=1 Tax=Mesobacillus foraminis TaxID=279826 RepID=UPI001BECAA97|nr:CYTH domain-containing protein [Mesobacillus foraminis]MBT2756366.1 CYTH domain-containing protein [Mesobacillus foraminis]